MEKETSNPEALEKLAEIEAYIGAILSQKDNPRGTSSTYFEAFQNIWDRFFRKSKE